MKCKLCALLMAALLLFMPVCAYAQTEESADAAATAPMDGISKTYDVDSGLYTYSFEDGASFTASVDLSLPDAASYVLLLFSDDDNVSIIVTRDGEPYDYDPDKLIEETGKYDIAVLHTLKDGTIETFSYSVTIKELSDIQGEIEQLTDVSRIQLSPDGIGYSCSFDELGKVYCSVADGEFSSSAVKLEVGELLGCDIIRNGEIYDFPGNGLISEDGFYNVTITAAHDTGGIEIRKLSFAIFTEPSAALGIYFPPYGYKLDSVLLDGEEYPFTEDMCRFTRDGSYQVYYSNENESKMTVLRRDTTPPVIYFNGGSQLVFAQEVEVTTDGDCTLEIYKNGDNVYEDTILRGNGVYRVIATDAAGNTTTARVEITAPSAINPMLFAVIGGALAVISLIYIITEKRKGPVVR